MLTKGEQMSTEAKKNGSDRVADQIIAALDAGTAPWRKPWVSTGYVALSLSTKRAYRGVNQMLMNFTAGAAGYESPWWGTYKQIAAQGGQIRKGEKGTYVVYFTMLEKSDQNDPDATKKIPMLKGFTVFNAEQADWENGAPEYEKPEPRSEFDSITEAEAVVARYVSEGGPSLHHGGDRAYYSPSLDEVHVPAALKFIGNAEYYSTLFHELGHSTGHSSRLARDSVVDAAPFGSENYGREELVAEFTAAFLCGATGVAPTTLDNSAAYIANWKQAIQNDPKCVVWAASRAQKAADMIRGIVEEAEATEPVAA